MRFIERTLIVTALMCLGFCAWAWVDSGLYQMVQGRRLDGLLGRAAGESRDAGAAAIAVATRAEVARSGLVGRIEIPRLGLQAIVAEGIDPRTLRRAVGHVTSTPLPGEPGNVALAGHRDSFFSRLRNVRLGDRVRMTTPEGVIEYRVESKGVVGPERTEVLRSSGAPTLTLITCFPFRYVGAAPERFVVRARQVAGPGRPVTLPRTEIASGVLAHLPGLLRWDGAFPSSGCLAR
jgi:sortase A